MNEQVPSGEQVSPTHIQSFWPLFGIIILAAAVGGFVVWLSYGSIMQDQIGTIVPAVHKVHRITSKSTTTPTTFQNFKK